MMTILAEPNLTASSGRPASFLAGGEIPIPTPGNQAGQITVTYKPFGVSLEFTPTLIQNKSNCSAGEAGSEFAVAGRGRQGQRRRPAEPDGPAGRYDGGGGERPDVCDRWFVPATDVVGFRQKPPKLPTFRFSAHCFALPDTVATRPSSSFSSRQCSSNPCATAASRPPSTGPRHRRRPGRLSSRPGRCPSRIPALCSNDPSRVHDAAYSAVYLCLAVAASALAGCAAAPPYPDQTVYWGTFPQQPPDYSPDYASVPVVDRNGRTRYVLVPKACLTPDPTEPPFLGPHLPPGCANAHNLQRMAERQSDLVRGRPLGAAPAAPSARAAQEYIYGTKGTGGPLGGGLPRFARHQAAGLGLRARRRSPPGRGERDYAGLWYGSRVTSILRCSDVAARSSSEDRAMSIGFRLASCAVPTFLGFLLAGCASQAISGRRGQHREARPGRADAGCLRYRIPGTDRSRAADL